MMNDSPDANNPSEVLDAFDVSSAHLLCVSSVPGVTESDFRVSNEESLQALCCEGEVEDEENSGRGRVEWVELSSEDQFTYIAPDQNPSPRKESAASAGAEGSSADSKKDAVEKRRELPAHVKDGLAKYKGIKDVTTALPTVWMGTQNQYVYIHSAVTEWRKCIKRIKMPDAVLSIVHYKGRIFAALANGKMAIFHREETGEWLLKGFHTVTIGKPQSSVRCVTMVASRIWCAYRNCIFVFNSETLRLERSVITDKPNARKGPHESGRVIIRSIPSTLDSTLRLYHAHTMQHMQDVDIEPYVSKMLGTSKLGFSFIRITALLVSCRRLWIGTGNGVILSVPLSETNETKVEVSSGDSKESGGMKGPGGLVRVYSDPAGGDRLAPGTFIPYCNMTQAQLSFHGHKDAVKFFVAVPGCGGKSENSLESAANDKSKATESATSSAGEERNMVVVSGGDGYIDFRIGEDEEEEKAADSSSSGLSQKGIFRKTCHR